jgi:hypothetical protein
MEGNMDDEVVPFREWMVQGSPGDINHPGEGWESLNKRRLELIEKEAGGGLSEEEQSELETIQEVTGRYLNVVASLPLEKLGRFEERARRAGIRLEEA